MDEASDCSSESDYFASFHPDYSHQHFGDEQKIRGYQELKIDIWLHSLSLRAMISMRFDTVGQLGWRGILTMA